MYQILGIEKTATPAEIKKAYRKLALLKHPDKNPDDPAAAENFQKLNKAYQVLSNPKKRQKYDQFGDDGEDDFNSTEWLNAYEYYRALHPEITKQDYKRFVGEYKNSEEEKQDLLDFYEENDGDITGILECIMCSENEDLPRFVKFFEESFKLNLIEKTEAYEISKDKVSLMEDEKSEAKKEKAKLKKKKQGKENSMADLEKMILARKGNAFGGFMNYMEQKYGQGEEQLDMPNEEAF